MEKVDLNKPIQSRRLSGPVIFILIALVGSVGFYAGLNQYQIFRYFAPMFGIRVSQHDLDLSSVQNTYRQLAENYDGELDDSKLIDGANRGLVKAVGDPYTVYLNKKEAEEFNNDLNGNIGGGVGAEIGAGDKFPYVVRTLEGTPAEKAGLKAGDIIIRVNDKPTDGWSTEETAKAIRGDVGTTVKIVILRDNEEKVFSITRAEIIAPSIESEIKDGIGIVIISRFDGEAVSQATKVATEFKSKGVKGVVLDLRGNGGGLLTSAQGVASLWLNDKVIVTERRAGLIEEELRSKGKPILESVPTVVLVNKASASASEIVAGALQDYGAAKLVGETTYGKGTVQKLVGLDLGSVLKVTVARWFTPKGRNISSEGIKPDIEVQLTRDDAKAKLDPQLDKAMDMLKNNN